MKRVKPKILLSILFVLTIITCINGQDHRFSEDGFSINPKLGIFNWGAYDAGFNGGFELNVFKNKFIYSADYYRFEELVLFTPSPAQYYNQIGIMMGQFVGEELFRFQYQAGIAPIWGIKRTGLIQEGTGLLSTDYYDYKNFSTVGLVAKLGFKIYPAPYFSIGIDLQANINLENTVYMPMISIEIGKLRDKINKP